MKLAIAVFLLFASIFFFGYDYFLVSLVLVVAAVYILLHRPAKELGQELMQDLEEAEGQVPDKGVWEEGLKTAGGMAGEQAFSDNEKVTNLKAITVTRWKLKPEKAGEASKKAIDFFKKLFG